MVSQPVTLSQSLAPGWSGVALGDEARVSLMWRKELEVSYHRPLVLVLSCLQMRKSETRGKKTKQRKVKCEEWKMKRSPTETWSCEDQTSHSTSPLSSAANSYLATPSWCSTVDLSWQHGPTLMLTANSYGHLTSEMLPTSPPQSAQANKRRLYWRVGCARAASALNTKFEQRSSIPLKHILPTKQANQWLIKK